jgi:hypothetical protein
LQELGSAPAMQLPAGCRMMIVVRGASDAAQLVRTRIKGESHVWL